MAILFFVAGICLLFLIAIGAKSSEPGRILLLSFTLTIVNCVIAITYEGWSGLASIGAGAISVLLFMNRNHIRDAVTNGVAWLRPRAVRADKIYRPLILAKLRAIRNWRSLYKTLAVSFVLIVISYFIAHPLYKFVITAIFVIVVFFGTLYVGFLLLIRSGEDNQTQERE